MASVLGFLKRAGQAGLKVAGSPYFAAVMGSAWPRIFQLVEDAIGGGNGQQKADVAHQLARVLVELSRADSGDPALSLSDPELRAMQEAAFKAFKDSGVLRESKETAPPSLPPTHLGPVEVLELPAGCVLIRPR